MSGALEVAAIGMRAQQAALEAIASNVSNVNTPAFKRADLRFSALVDSGGTQGNLFVDRVSGVAQTEVPDLDRAGQLYATSNYKDIAINGSGFIELMGPAGQTYLWRGGTLRILEDGQLATPNGFALRANVVLPAGATDLNSSLRVVTLVSRVPAPCLALGPSECKRRSLGDPGPSGSG